MTDTTATARRRPGSPSATGRIATPASSEPGHRFRPASRRTNRIAAGVVLGALAIGGNVLVYTNLDDREAVLQVVRDLPAGSIVTADDLRTVDVDVDGSVNVVAGDDVDQVVGYYAKVRLVSGSLVTADALQSTPLVTPGASIVAVQVAEGALPLGLRERAAVQLVVPPAGNGADEVLVIDGRAVGLPTGADSVTGRQTLSVEVAAADAPKVAAADDIRIVLTEPRPDPASESE